MYFQKAKEGHNEAWRYIFGAVTIYAAMFAGNLPLLLYLDYRSRQSGVSGIGGDAGVIDFEALGMDKNLSLALIVISFFFALAALWLVMRHLHHRSLGSLVSPEKRINFRKIFFGFGLWFGLTALFELINYFIDPGQYEFRFSLGPFFILLLVALFLLPLQTTFEEMFHRGYLLQAFGLATNNRWAPLLITTLIFAGVHLLNPEIEQFGFFKMSIYYLLAGLALGLMTVLDDSLELALGVHAATNIYAAVVSTYEGAAISTDALFRTKETDITMTLIAFIILSVIFLTICAIKYRWDFARLFRKLDQNGSK